MKTILILIALINFLLANNKSFVLNHSDLLDNRVYKKINFIGGETSLKLGIDVYLDIKGDNGIDLTLPMKQRFALITKNNLELISEVKNRTQNDFVILVFAIDQKYVNILFSNKKLKSIIDKDDVLDNYVTPLLDSKDKNILKSKVSAAALNGYGQIVYSLANNKNIKIESNIGNAGKITSQIWKIFIYTLVFFGIIAYTIIILREKKNKRI